MDDERRYPVLQQSLRVIRSIAPDALGTVVDIGVQRRTDFLMDVLPDVHHHLFEPVSTYYGDLRRGYDEAGIAYDLHEVALSDENGELYLHETSVDGSGRITHAQIKPERHEDMDFLVGIKTVPTRRLDDVLTREALGDLRYLVKLDVDGVEEKIVAGGHDVIGGASFVVIEASIGRQDLCSRAAMLEKLGFRMFDICDPAYYFGQLALVDLVMINDRLRADEIKFRPWQYTEGKVVWPKWQHGYKDMAGLGFPDPFSD